MAWPEEHDGTYQDRLTEDQEQDQASYEYGLMNDPTNYTNRMLAQTFQPGATKEITAVELHLAVAGSPDGSVWVEIWTTTGTPPSPNAIIEWGPNNECKARSGKIRVEDLGGGTNRFCLPKGIRLSQGTTYAIVLVGDYGESSSNYVKWAYQKAAEPGDLYANGQSYQYDGDAVQWYPTEAAGWNEDFYFRTYYGETNNPILDILYSGVGQLANSFLRQITDAGKVSGAALTSLANTPSGAGELPMANVPIKMIDHTWEGDDSNNKEIDLGDDYDLIFIWLEESKGATFSHLGMAYAFREVYGSFYQKALVDLARHSSMAAINPGWQGKMTGGDANKIKLGSVGSDDAGTNSIGQSPTYWTYRLIGFKFSSME